MTRAGWWRVIALLLRLGLGAIFAYAAITKLVDPRTFAQEIANYRILPSHLVAPAAVALPASELVVGATLVAGIWVAEAALAATFLLGIFTAAVASSLWRGIDLVCGCFGGQELVSGWTLVRDLALLSCALVVATTALRARARETRSAESAA